jgi:ABC-type transporter Mla subunit MlaD
MTRSNESAARLLGELHEISAQARRLSMTSAELLGGSRTGVDRALVDALATLSRTMSKAASTVASLPQAD